MAERIDRGSFALGFQKQITVELTLLNKKLGNQLRDEISRVYETSLYTDLEITLKTGSIRAHSCIIQTRVPKFYSKYFAKNKSCLYLPDKVNHQLVDSFVRSLYTGNDINKGEQEIIQKLGNLKNLYKQQTAQVISTPESDVYLTPQASPSLEQRSNSLHTRCLSDSLIDELQTRQGNLCKNNALYYSLVPVDEVFDSSDYSSGGVLEKELAEQDELLESFKSILSKERKTIKTRKRNKPTSLTLASSHAQQHNNVNNSVQKIYCKRKDYVENKNIINSNNCSNNSKQKNIYSNQFVEEFNKHYNKNASLQESCTFPPFYLKPADHNVLPDFSNVEDAGSQNRMNCSAVNTSNCNNNNNSGSKNSNSTHTNPKVESCLKESDDVMSNPETEVIGQDSVLDAGSSGYMTGSSPRDHTVSEISYGVDVTEAASSEDIPHDNDRSVASSSVSSDAGTWDSTFPATMEEELTSNVVTVVGKSSSSRDALKDDKEQHKTYSNQQNSMKNGSNLPDLVPVDCLDNVDLFQLTHINISCSKSSVESNFKENSLTSKSKDCISNFDSKNKFSTDVVLSPSINSAISKAPDSVLNHNNGGSKDGIVDSKIHSKIEKSSNHLLSDTSSVNGNGHQLSSNNFFIDAASLLDESELVPPPKLSKNDEVLVEKIERKKKIDCGNNIEVRVVESDQENTSGKLSQLMNNHELHAVTNTSPNLDDFIISRYDKKLSPDITTSENENRSLKNSTSENLSFSERRTSLVRRNTFELEPDDEKLAILRQEYERRRGNQFFNDSPVDDLVQNGNNDVQLNASVYEPLNEIVGNISPKKQPPDTLFLEPKNLEKSEEEIHSPDSLNNDNLGDNLFEEKVSESKESLEKTDKGNNNKLIHIQEIEDEISRISLESSNYPLCKQTKEQIFSRQMSDNSHDRSNLLISNSNKFVDLNHQNVQSYVGSFDRLNKIECTPIVSGGASIIDFSPPVSCASPLMSRRKTEFTPILSGGSINIPDPEPKPKLKTNPPFTASWVVDMSDTVKSPEMRKKRADSSRSSNSSEHSELTKDDNLSKSDQKSVKSSSTALGFFIPLDDPKPSDKNHISGNYNNNNNNGINSSQRQLPVSSESASESKTSSQSNLNLSCGFFIDLNKGSNDRIELLKEKTVEKNSILPDKKLFSMFIDISESSSTKSTENGSPISKINSPNLFSNKKIKTKSHTNRFFSKHSEEVRPTFESQVSSESSIEFSEHPEVSKGKQLFSDNLNTPPPSRQISTNDNSTTDLSNDTRRKGGFFMFIEAESCSSPVPRRRTLPSGLRPNYQRHSWNLESRNLQTSEEEVYHKKEHKRAHSVSVDKSLLCGNLLDEKKSSSVASLSKNSSKEFSSGVFESGPASMDETAMRFPEKNNRAMISSWHGPVKPSFELQKVIARGERNEIKESKTILGLSKVADSSCSNNGKRINKDLSNFDINSESSVSCRSDETFNVSNISDNSSHKEPNDATFIVNDVSNVANATSNELELSTPSHDIISELSKDDSEPAETDLSQIAEPCSDYSKCNKKKEITCILESPCTPDHCSSLREKHVDEDEENKSSFVKLSDLDKEPAKLVVQERRTINRMSRSIPETSWIESKMMTRSATSRSLSRIFPHLNIRTPENDDPCTDISDNISSMQSSIDPSALEGSTEETDASFSLSGTCSRLGEDLLRMFLDEISPDVTVEVGGRRIKAHKCILSSRCQYFAAMLSGGWVESAGNVISLQGFSYNAVHFALCHIYSGASNIPDSINIVELATLADMLCLEGLKEVIMYTLKVKYCHFFHKPCPMCTVGVLECLPLAAAYGLDEIYRKSLKWITKYFVRVWPTKGFAQLPRELIDKCFKQLVVHMSVENVLETVMCCEKLQATIPQVRWADPVFALTHKLLETAVKYITQHFSGVLSSEMFLSLGKDSTWNLDRLEETLVSSTERLSPDQACRSHSRLHTILTVAESPDPPSEMTWNPEFIAMLGRIAAGVESSLIKQAGRAARTPAWAQMEPQLRHKIQDAACLIIIPGDDRRRARHSSLLRRSEGNTSSGLRSSDLHQVKVAMTQQNVGKKNTTTTTAGTANTTTTANRISLPNQPSKPSPKPDEKTSKTKSWPYKLAEVKSRYLEQRTPVKAASTTSNMKEKTCSTVPTQRKNPSGKPIISSSDSSRTSSPAMRRSVVPRMGRRTLLKDSPATKKEADALTISTDSLVENVQTRPSTSAKAKSKNVNESNEINGNLRTPILGNKSRRTLPNKIDGIKMNSAESLTKVNGETKSFKSSSVSGSQNILGKEIGTKSKSSPVPLNKKSNSHGSPRVKESPVISRAKPVVNSTQSPALRRNVTLQSQNNQQANKGNQETKGNPIKRTSTYRIQNRSISSPTKASMPAKSTREPLATTSNNKGNLNDARLQKSVNNNSSPVISRVKQPQLTVGSRSGTFLKDEPTVLRKVQTADIE